MDANISAALQPYFQRIILTGCGISLDGWTNVKQEAILNLAATAPAGSVMLDAINTGGAVKDTMFMVNTLKKGFAAVGGPQNVVVVCMDNAPVNRAAGKIIEDEFPGIFSIPCVCHLSDLVVKHACEEKGAAKLIKASRAAVAFVKNHSSLLVLYRKHAAAEGLPLELLKPGEQFEVLLVRSDDQ